ncbi:MAG: 50S ribosomal protein L11 methyltransferase [Gemmatimonadaceae bacterium]|nr:50S ribosomal protein L11 methyltransferase [Gemmatimonadaceae bacterium]
MTEGEEAPPGLIRGTPSATGAQWLAVRVTPGASRDAAMEALFAAGSEGVHEEGADLVTHFPEGSDAGAITRLLHEMAPGATVATEWAPAIDWSEAWKDGVHAHDLGALTIAPPWLAGQHDPARTIVIDPGMAFGTGEHATTRGVIRLLQGVIRPADRVADLGAGSAILAIAAAKLGAAWVAAIEIDGEAIPNAEENIARNGVIERVTVFQGDAATLLPLIAPVQLVLANIISSVLVNLLPEMAVALDADGRVILSGILREERAFMLGVLDDQGWRVLGEDAEDAWWSVAIARR